MFLLAESSEAATAAVAVFLSVAGAGVVVIKWLPRHFDRLIENHNRDRAQARADFLAALDKRDVALDKRETNYREALAREVAECGRQRDLDRQQRDLDRSERATYHENFLRVIGHLAGDTGKFSVEQIRGADRPRKEKPQ